MTATADSAGHGPRTVARQIASFEEATEIWSLAFSPDGQHLATSAAIGPNVRIWKWRGSPHIEHELFIPTGGGPGTRQSGLTYSPDGKRLAISHSLSRESEGSTVVRIWDTASGAIVQQIAEPGRGAGIIGQIEFSRDGSEFMRTFARVAWRPGDQFLVHRSDTLEPLWGVHTAPFYPESLAISPDGKLIALGGAYRDRDDVRTQIYIVDRATHGITNKVDVFAPGKAVSQLSWNHDGTLLAAGTETNAAGASRKIVEILDTHTFQETVSEDANDGDITGLAYTSDGRYLIECIRGFRVEIWDAQHSHLLQRIATYANAAAVSRDGGYLAIVGRSDISVWELH